MLPVWTKHPVTARTRGIFLQRQAIKLTRCVCDHFRECDCVWVSLQVTVWVRKCIFFFGKSTVFAISHDKSSFIWSSGAWDEFLHPPGLHLSQLCWSSPVSASVAHCTERERRGRRRRRRNKIWPHGTNEHSGLCFSFRRKGSEFEIQSAVKEKPFMKPFINKGSVLVHKAISFIMTFDRLETLLKLLYWTAQSLSERQIMFFLSVNRFEETSKKDFGNPLFYRSVKSNRFLMISYRCWHWL